MSKPNSFWRKTREIISYPVHYFSRSPQPKPILFKYEQVDEFPDVYEPFKIYLIREKDNLWAGGMLCPCGCGDVITLNFSKKYRPRWSVKEHPDGSVTLTPSIRRRDGCRSHFFVRNGKIDWVPQYKRGT